MCPFTDTKLLIFPYKKSNFLFYFNTYTGIGTSQGGHGSAVWMKAGSDGCSQGPADWCWEQEKLIEYKTQMELSAWP